ncbi:HEPN domain-containing protein [Pseudomonas sp. ICMP 561]|uniref:HEPN domain-containing protein n=1 Tax=Pseudomonas sp. ICMP 561 TaxID=1718918 RepID=UPI000C074DD0|nr:HEPN domain-containing protein [Pseudomonas sp. ICMP 561]PHN17212.1 hypothetical protein AO242_21205 [Pseudomonas sp. ICMP 561]
MMALDDLIVVKKIEDPQQVFTGLNGILAESEPFQNWISIYPLGFNTLNCWIQTREAVEGVLELGRFRLIESTRGHEQLQDVLKEEFGVSRINADEYRHQNTQGGGALAGECLLAFPCHGALDRRDLKAGQGFTFFCRLAELFAQLSDSQNSSWPNGGRPLRHAFHVRSEDGFIDRHPLRSQSRLNIDPSDEFYELLVEQDFGWFADRIFYPEDKVLRKLKTALEHFSRAYRSEDKFVRLTASVIAMEAAFYTAEKVSIGNRLSRLVSALCFPPPEQAQAFETMKAIYCKRSKALHGDNVTVSATLAKQSHHFAALAKFQAFKLYSQLSESSAEGEIERRYLKALSDLVSSKGMQPEPR